MVGVIANGGGRDVVRGLGRWMQAWSRLCAYSKVSPSPSFRQLPRACFSLRLGFARTVFE